MMTGPRRSGSSRQHLHLAEDQTLMSSERTYAGWLRTALTAIAVALGFTALFRDAEAVWISKGIATLFLLLAIGVLAAADRRAAEVQRRLDHHFIRGASRSTIRLISWAAGGATLALLGTIWFLI